MGIRTSETVHSSVGELVRRLNQTQGRILLALIFAGKPMRLKDLALVVGAPTSQVCYNARALVRYGAAIGEHGIYQSSPSIQSVCIKTSRRMLYRQKKRVHPTDEP